MMKHEVVAIFEGFPQSTLTCHIIEFCDMSSYFTLEANIGFYIASSYWHWKSEHVSLWCMIVLYEEKWKIWEEGGGVAIGYNNYRVV